MNGIARMPADKRADIFAETADRKGLPEAIIEKDFWVCWVLKQLFSIDALSARLVFKGGTSLSKVFHAINRFSEDIDLAVDYAALGFTGARDPRREDISKTRRARILAEMMTECQRYIGSEFLEALKTRCRDVLGAAGAWSLGVSEQDPNVVRFQYPAAAAKGLAYVVPQVVLELGTHAEFVPRDHFTIRAFAGEEFPDLVADRDIEVVALLAKRTFWEKATILHAEYHRPLERPLPDRYSRHYYDVAMLAQGTIRSEALADMALLAQVVRHKETFYPSGWAHYDRARPGSLRLLPPENRAAALERDYRDMTVMIFGQPPPFDEIMEPLATLEEEINS
ncbi:MAG TPA: nucleotidyl transferase AbiEii/AbiGii toxin family protein [Terriglobia bacterium]|nr:nucleotidyl transferase AbiEii/AbiGii toxin family protein [Terriglobia bacterium]